jgi:hypothetical protein
LSARDVWRWTDERGVQRVVDTDELRTALSTAVLPASTLVWREGMKEWAAASSVPELASAAFAAVSAPGLGAGAAKPGRAALDSDVFDARGTLKDNKDAPKDVKEIPKETKEKERRSTLVGLTSTSTEVSDVRVAVTATAPGGVSTPSPVTHIPPYGGPGRDGNPIVPPAPRIPVAPALPVPQAKPAPKRRITSSDVDGLWATTTHSDEDETMPRRSRPSELAAAAAAAAEAAALRKAVGARKPPPLPPSDPPAPGTNGTASKTTSSRPPPPPPRAIPPMAVPATPAVPSVRLKAPSPPERPLPPKRPTPTLSGVAPAPVDPPAAIAKPAVPAAPVPKAPPHRPPASRSKPPPKPPPRDRSAPPKPIKTLQSARDTLESFPGLAEAIAEADDPSDTAVTGLRASPLDQADLDAISYDEDDAAPAIAAIPVISVTAEGAVAPHAAAPPLDASSHPRPVGQELTAPLPLASLEGDGRSPLPSFSLGGDFDPSPREAEAAAASPAASASPAPASLALASPAADAAVAAFSAEPAPQATERAADTARRPQPELSKPPGSPSRTTSRAAARAASEGPDSSDGAKARGPSPSSPRLSLASVSGPNSAVPAMSRQDPGVPSMSRFVANADGFEGGTRGRLAEQVAVPISSLVGAGGLLIGMVVAAFFVGRASLTATGRLTAHPTFGAVPALARAALPTPPKPCWMVKQPAMWAPAASRTVPFDAVASTRGTLAVGYARDAHEALGIEVDLATGEVKSRLNDRAKEEIERVVPTPAVDFRVARAGAGPLRSAIEVPVAQPFAVGLADGAVALAAPPDATPSPLWPLTGDDGIAAASVRSAGDRGFALVFRRGAGIWGGFVGADHKPAGQLVNVVGSGGAVGKPAVAWNGREVAVIFGDRPSAEGHYEIRVGHGPPGGLPAITTVLPLPRGGPGGDAFAPDIAGLPDGRWLLMWTEGGSGARAVRAQTLAADFSALGDPIALSPPAGNFGQGVIGVVGPYAATIFLSKGESSYELWGAVLQCGG